MCADVASNEAMMFGDGILVFGDGFCVVWDDCCL